MSDEVENLPYRGVVPFSEDNADYFFGRDNDAKNVTDSLLWQRVTVLHSETGVGKTSIIRAAVLQDIEKITHNKPMLYRGPWLRGFFQALFERANGICETDLRTIDAIAEKWSKLHCAPYVIIFDQFEEYFTYHQDTGDEEFEKQLARLVNRRDLDAHVLFSIRSDAFFELTRLEDRIPDITSNAIRLDPLDETAARDAILKPLERYNEQFREGLPPVEIEPDLVEVLLQQTQRPHPWVPPEAGNTQPRAIDTASLQLTLTKVWEEDRKLWNQPPHDGKHYLRTETFNRLGGVKGIADRYVENVLGAIEPAEQNHCAGALDLMVTRSGRKIALSAGDLATHVSIERYALQPLLDKLCDRDRQLLRRTPDPRHAAEPLFEIFHDWLALPIRRWVDTIRERQRTAAAEARAAEETARADEIEDLRRNAARATVSLLVHLSKQQLEDGNARMAALLAVEASRYEIAAFPKLQDKLCDRLHAALRYPMEREVLQDAQNKFHVAGFSPDGRRIVTAYYYSGDLAAAPTEDTEEEENDPIGDPRAQTVVELRDTNGLLLETAPQTFPSQLLSISFSFDGSQVIAVSDDGSLYIWEFTTGAVYQSYPPDDLVVYLAALGPPYFAFVTDRDKETLFVWNGKADVRRIRRKSTAISALTFIDSKRLALGLKNGKIEYTDVDHFDDVEVAAEAENSTGDKEEVAASTRPVSSIAIDVRRKWLASGSAAGTVVLGKVRGQVQMGEQRYELAGHKTSVCAAQFSADGQFLLTAARDGMIRRWDITSVIPVQVLEGHEKRVPAVVFSPDGRKIATGSADRTVRLWDAASGDLLQTIEGHGGPITAVQFDPGGTRLVTASWDRTARIWGVATGEALIELSGHTKPLTAAGFSPDGRMIVTASDDKTARLWDAVDGALIATLDGHEGPVYAVAFDPTGNRVLTASKDGTARLWQASARPSHRPYKMAECAVHAIAFSPDGQRFVAGQEDGIASLWDSERGECVHRLEGHTEAVRAVAFTPDGQVIVTAGLDGRVRFWDSATGEEMQTLQADSVQAQPVHAIALSPDGHAIVLGTAAAVAEVWRVNLLPLDLAGLVAYANGLNLRPLTDHEREEFGLEGRPAQDGEPAQPTAGDVPAPSAARD